MKTVGSEVEHKIATALNQLNVEELIPMDGGNLAKEIAKRAAVSTSTVYRYKHIWMRHTSRKSTTLDSQLQGADPEDRFLISIRMPAEVLTWLKSESQKRHMGYQSFLIRVLAWVKESPTFVFELSSDKGEQPND